MLAYITPDDGGGVYLCRRFRFRAEMAAIITGALEALTYPDDYEQVGNLTPDDMASFAQ
jgi:hypothetical protein